MLTVYRWNEMRDDEKKRLLRRTEVDIEAYESKIKPVVEDVRDNGDSAIAKYTKQFDGIDLKPSKFKVTAKEFDEAEKKLPKKIKAAIEKSVANVRCYHERQMPQALWITPVEPGVFAGEKITPIASVALYVPRGKGSFPSVMVMLGIPAVVAGVEKIAVITPPGPGGEADAGTLVAARACGIRNVYRVGGAQGVAAVAYGTKKIPKMDKVIGPGSGYVTAAKHLLYGTIDVGLPAGPSESIILADATTDPMIAALDLLIEQEHGPDSTALLVTDSEELIKKVDAKLPALIKKLPEPRKTFIKKGFSAFGGAVLTRDMKQAVEFVNLFAPEHMEILISDPLEVINDVNNAGEILLGPDTPITLGNFNLGIDAILPTGGFARSFSGVTVYDFLKRSSIGFVTREGFKSLAPMAETLARYEGFPAHAMAVAERLKILGQEEKKRKPKGKK
ncbi:MAG TPA: histidinol dehydrogenase [bacterium]|nr:histidinol dehydrogenase [bacterium]